MSVSDIEKSNKCPHNAINNQFKELYSFKKGIIL